MAQKEIEKISKEIKDKKDSIITNYDQYKKENKTGGLGDLFK
mgnify:CR=1 FL=1